MATGPCPRCQKALEGQVKLCSLCGTTYHADCLRDTRDCVLCATQTSGKNTTLTGVSKKEGPNLYLIVIVLFIIAALIVLAIVSNTPPPPQASRAESLAIEAMADLDLLRHAVKRFEDKHGKRFTGVDTTALASQLPSVPTDPWGRSYLIDGSVGIVATFGADGKPGGDDEDEDIVRYFRGPLQIEAARYFETSSAPIDCGILQVEFNKPFTITNAQAVVAAFELVERAAAPTGFDDDTDEPSSVFASFPEHWTVARDSSLHAPQKGLLALRSTARHDAARFLAAIVPERTALNFNSDTKDFGLTEFVSPRTKNSVSPCDRSFYGDGVEAYLRPVRPLPHFCDEAGGVTVEAGAKGS